MSKILRIDLTANESVLSEATPEQAHLGGRGLTAAIVAAEIDPAVDPLSYLRTRPDAKESPRRPHRHGSA
ncbi:MAG: aldehyde ferredoxin oxidoreductase N-terminal domain-containing protein [Thermoleophilia bacterium]|jgi:aldehyde:ferredoxin oxidoreductase